uniref:Sec1 family domain-containing protein 1 n=1 Tax=Petromyzon marinus TaxID=7757 RepID=A0AAJ7WKY7_PETMA|nr:sec1 family domain-containing protein 1 [Petromyzon marinus]
MVAEKLDKKIRDNLRDARNSLFTGDGVNSGHISFQRPLLLLLDRGVDLATPLHHTWTYQALVHDVMDLRLNRVSLSDAPPGDEPHGGARPKRRTVKTYDLDAHDAFWQQHKGSPFPEVAVSVQSELEEYRLQEEQVKSLKTALGLEGDGDDGAISLLSDTSAQLTSAVSSLPELLEKKRLIDTHTNIATAVLEHIKARRLDVYFELEERMMGKLSLDRPLMEFITDPDAGTPEDKMRLFLIHYICSPHPPSEAELDAFSVGLERGGCDLTPLTYIRRWRSFSRMTSTSISSSTTSYTGGGTNTISMFSRLVNTGSQFVMEGVKNLVIKRHKLPATCLLDRLMEMKASPETDDYRYFDPKLIRGNDSSTARSKNPFQEAVVFMIGGGNYIEYQNLMDYIKTKPGKRVTYGSTELLNSTQFLKQLSKLGANL